EKRFYFGPVALAGAYVCGAVDDVHGARQMAGDGRYVDLVIHQHRRKAFLGRDTIKGNVGRWRESGGTAVAQFLGALHVPVDFILRHAEIVFENAARPERGSLLIFTDADALADDIARFFDARVNVVGLLGMKKTPARKNRQRNHVGATRTRD